MRFVDFELRAWQADDTHVQVLVHRSPAGCMRRPVTVPFSLADFRGPAAIFEDGVWWSDGPAVTMQMTAMGRELGAVILPPEALSLLDLSLARLADDDGLRIRLCLDPALAALNWEFLRRPQPHDSESLDGFLALDPRLSIVREPAWGGRSTAPVLQPRRMVFVGCRWDEDWDRWDVEEEYQTLTSEIASNKDALAIEPFIPAADKGIELALAAPSTIFHYSGHTGVAKGRAFLTRHAFSEVVACRITSRTRWRARISIAIRSTSVRSVRSWREPVCNWRPSPRAFPRVGPLSSPCSRAACLC